MNTLDRRHFLGSTLLLTGLVSARAQAQATLPPLDEASPQAMAMGYPGYFTPTPDAPLNGFATAWIE